MTATALGGTAWDVVVVGAGPSGSMTALAAAAGGLRVLVVERQPMPRPKVCGCCLNAASLSLLRRVGLEGMVLAEAAPLEHLLLYGWGRRARVPLPSARVLSRERLDHELVKAAVDRGARLAAPYRARFGQGSSRGPELLLQGPAGVEAIRAAVVVLASGLEGLVGAESARVQGPHRRIGLGATLPDSASGHELGTVTMAAAAAGYVGLVRLPGGMLNVAASVPAVALDRHGGAQGAVGAVLEQAGLPALCATADWRGTPALRRRRSPLPPRVLAVGDAAGFWEPFTGEGIAWALESGLRTGAALPGLVAGWSPAVARRWEREQRRWMSRRQRTSRLVGAVCERPWLARAALRLAEAHPRWVQRMVPSAAVGDQLRPGWA